MSKLFWNILKANKNDYIRTILGCSWVISLIYFSTAVGGCLSYISTGAIPQMTYLLIDVEKEFLIPYAILLILLVLILIAYIRKRAAVYKTLTIFGMKRKHKYEFIIWEYLGIVCCSIIFGILAGDIESKILKMILGYFFEKTRHPIQYGYAPLKLTLIISFLIFGLGFIVCDQAISCLGIDYLISNESETREKVKTNNVMCLVTIVMAGITIISLITYWGKSGTTIPTLLAIITILLFLYFYGAYFIRNFEKDKKYYKKIFWMDNWCSNFYRHVNVSYVVAAFLFIIIFTFSFQIIDTIPTVQKTNYPYDLVWGANKEDKGFLNNLKEEYGITAECIPSIRVTSGDYGEHMGISASEYRKLTGCRLKLRPNEIYVVYQRDKSEYGTLGIDYGKKTPRLYIGNADADIWIYTMRVMPGNEFTRNYKIIGDTNKIILGNFKSRQLEESGIRGKVFEEVIVFSDLEYKRISKSARGSDLTIAMNIPQHYKQVVNKIYKYAEKNSQVNFFDYKSGNLIYEKRKLMTEEQKDNMLKVCAMVINVITLVICSIFTLCNNIASYKNNFKWKYTFFYRLGMDEMMIKKYLHREILLTGEVACVSSVPFAFILVLIKILYKDLSGYWMIRYVSESIVVIIILIMSIYLIVSGIAWSLFKQIERGIQDE